MADVNAGSISYTIGVQGLEKLRAGLDLVNKGFQGTGANAAKSFKALEEQVTRVKKAQEAWALSKVGGNLEEVRRATSALRVELGLLDEHMAEEKPKKVATAWQVFSQRLAVAQKGLVQFGSTASTVFNTVTALMMNALSKSDPMGVERFQMAWNRLSIQIGRFFVPLLREVTKLVDSVASYLRSLSDTVRENVLHWATIIVVVAGVGFALNRIISVGQSVLGMFQGLYKVFALFGTGPLGWFIMLAAAITGLTAALGTGANATEQWATAWQNLVEGFNRLWAVLQPVVDLLVTIFVTVLGTILSILANLIGGLDATSLTLIGLGVAIILVAQNFDRLKSAFFAVVDFFKSLPSLLSSVKAGLAGVTAGLQAMSAASIATGIGAIVVAIGLITAALTGANSSLEDFNRQLQRSNTLAERLRNGQRVTAADVRDAGLSIAEQNRLLDQNISAQERAARAAAMLAQRQARGEGMGANPAAIGAAVEQGLQRAQERIDELPLFRRGEAGAIRQAEIGRSLRERLGIDLQRMSDEQRQRFINVASAQELMTGSGAAHSQEQARTIATNIAGVFSMSRTSVDFLRRLQAQGGTFAGTGRFEGQVRQPAPEFLQITDVWRKLMTGQEPSVQEQLLRDQLNQGGQQLQQLEQINAGVNGPNPPPPPGIQPG